MVEKNISFILSLLGLFLFQSCDKTSRQKNKEGAEYQIMTVEQGNCILKNEYSAALYGKQCVEIRPQVSGIITQICIDEGDMVHEGQILFIIDQVPYKAALETAIANVKSAEAQLATANLTVKSKEALYQERVISEFDLQTAKNEQAEANANLLQAKAQEINARNNLSYTEVKSPVNGIASMIPYRVGALVNSNITEPLVKVSDDSEIYAYFSMAENKVLDLIQQHGSLDQVLKNMTNVELTMNNGKPYPHQGKINAISGDVDKTTGAISLRAVFPNPERLLRNGGNGIITIPTELENAIIIPQSATYEIQNKIFTYKVVDGKAKSVPIEVFQLNNGTEYIVESGLQKGDVIITEGAGLVKEGTVINNSTKE